jgi:hypothetical protein
MEAAGGTLKDIVACGFTWWTTRPNAEQRLVLPLREVFSSQNPPAKYMDRGFSPDRSRIFNRDRSHSGVGLSLCALNKSTSITFVIKAGVGDSSAKTIVFNAQKTMYGGKHIAEGDPIFVFASENQGGSGPHRQRHRHLSPIDRKKAGISRKTPRVSITIKRTAAAKRQLGRSELKRFCNWNDGPARKRSLILSLYRQATNKIVGISDERQGSCTNVLTRGSR